MRLPGKQRTVRQTLWMCALLVLSLVLAGVSPAAGPAGTASPVMPRLERELEHRGEMEKVLSVVGHRTRNGQVLERMREKLFTLDERDLHLAASLCERISRDDDSAGANIAYSIVMALIVLS